MEENIWEISISCPALRLPILLSPEQGRRTEEPLNGSQQAEAMNIELSRQESVSRL